MTRSGDTSAAVTPVSSRIVPAGSIDIHASHRALPEGYDAALADGRAPVDAERGLPVDRGADALRAVGIQVVTSKRTRIRKAPSVVDSLQEQ